MTLTKPSKGSACNGCGVCCLAETCEVGLEAFGQDHQVCPALFYDSRFYCGLMTSPFEYISPQRDGTYLNKTIHSLGEDISAGYYRQLIGAGVGCDSED